MKVSQCDCCKSTHNVALCVMDWEGVHVPKPARREEGFVRLRGPDLCESCRVSLAHHWGRLASGELRVKS